MDSQANFLYLSPRVLPWREVFAERGLQCRNYADGGARITIGGRASNPAVLAALEKSPG